MEPLFLPKAEAGGLGSGGWAVFSGGQMWQKEFGPEARQTGVEVGLGRALVEPRTHVLLSENQPPPPGEYGGENFIRGAGLTPGQEEEGLAQALPLFAEHEFPLPP